MDGAANGADKLVECSEAQPSAPMKPEQVCKLRTWSKTGARGQKKAAPVQERLSLSALEAGDPGKAIGAGRFRLHRFDAGTCRRRQWASYSCHSRCCRHHLHPRHGAVEHQRLRAFWVSETGNSIG